MYRSASIFSGVGFYCSVGIGNLTNDSSLVLFLLEKRIPLDLVPLRYLITPLACSICPFDAWLEYLASIFAIVAMSGLVDILNQLSELTRT